ncbi:rab-like GTPase activating protein [Novymonas esmeraldas]|uniref:Rab-like GTPase activating protein n=1 Tax=Novymonas esmeraldas TaxID=1808958 RepID=A0AAW0F717_9TRYP
MEPVTKVDTFATHAAAASPTTVVGGSLVILPHAEEVELCRGSVPMAICSTTGRLNRRATNTTTGGDSSSKENEEGIDHASAAASPSPDTASQQQRSTAITTQVAAAVSAHRRAGVSKQVEYKCYDVFGFRVSEEEKAGEYLERRSGHGAAESLRTWESVVAHWPSVRPGKLKEYCRRGVPQPKRGAVWQRLLRSWGMKEQHPGEYARLRSQPLASADVEGVIERDLDRTFPTHRLFDEDGAGHGQQMLRSILRAYANYNVGVGYCQGMGFLAATLILQVEVEEDAFWAFAAVMEDKRYNMKAIFAPGFPQLQCTFRVFEALMRKRLPELYVHLHDRHQIHPSFYAVHWFMTVFTYYFNFGLVSRIWDMFLCEGWKPVYRIALALLKLEERRLLSLTTETELLLALKAIQESKQPVELLKTALKIKFKSAYVNKLVAEFNAQGK